MLPSPVRRMVVGGGDPGGREGGVVVGVVVIGVVSSPLMMSHG